MLGRRSTREDDGEGEEGSKKDTLWEEERECSSCLSSRDARRRVSLKLQQQQQEGEEG